MDYEQKQREAFYLIKKYSSYTWHAEIYRLWKRFCENYERDFYRHPVTCQVGRLAGTVYEPGEWDELNLKMFWAYAGDLEEGISALQRGDKERGYELLASGRRFGQWLYSRRFEEMDLSDFGYRRYKADGANEGIFADAQRAYDMGTASGIDRHVDNLRRDFAALQDKLSLQQEVPVAKMLLIPYGVPQMNLPSLPKLEESAPIALSGDEVPAMGIWVVEPDEDHSTQSYCMAYLRPWAPALSRVSEQEYEMNTRWDRTDDETYRKDSDTIKDYPVRWRLLWRDDRDYTGGRVPPEESDYLIYREPNSAPTVDAIQLRCEGGNPSPRTGWWTTPAAGGMRRRLAQGEKAPVISGDWGIAVWQFESDDEGGNDGRVHS
jgi:hypothetical protein